MAPLNWCFGFPYAPNEKIRAEAWDVVSTFYAKHFPDTPRLVHSATAVGEQFLRAKTRNEIVEMAEGYDLIVLIDADTLIHPEGIRRMVDRAGSHDLFVGKPFLRGTNLPILKQRNVAVLDEPKLTALWPQPKFNDPGAAWVIRPKSWWTVGGMDEAFRSWGGEDEAFSHMLSAFGGTIDYDLLPALKTQHTLPRWSADPEWAGTWERAAVYRHIWRHPELAAEWLTVRHQPGICEEWISTHGINLKRKL